MKAELEKIQAESFQALGRVTNVAGVDALEVEVLGRKGKLAGILAGIPALPAQERAGLGTLAAEVKQSLQAAFNEARQKFSAGSSAPSHFDATWPGTRPTIGHAHPVQTFLTDAIHFFSRLGYTVADGPEVESTAYNFDKLNIPPNHPSRDLWDTFYLQPKNANLVLRTHTSPVQLRYLEQNRPPVYVISPGRVYRHEATDASHETTFTQIEGLAIDTNLHVTDLIGTLQAFLNHAFGKVHPTPQYRRKGNDKLVNEQAWCGVKTRVRPHYYPFVEPGMDVDMSCLICGGKGCSVCKQSGWLEMLGAGMVHPTVLKNMKVDPAKYSGFAFGMGVERLVMLKHGIADVRHFLSGDVRFLEQFHS